MYEVIDLQGDIENYFGDCGYEVICDFDKLVDFLEYEGLLKTDEEVIAEIIEYYEIRCPYEFLNTAYMLDSDNDYIPLSRGWRLNDFSMWNNEYIDELSDNGYIKEL